MPKPAPQDSLAVVWSSGDPEVAHGVCLMYAHNAKLNGWFARVRLIIWGPSGKLLAADEAVQEKVHQMIADGVEVVACIACAKMLGVVEPLWDLGVEVKGMGPPLTEMLRTGWKVLCF